MTAPVIFVADAPQDIRNAYHEPYHPPVTTCLSGDRYTETSPAVATYKCTTPGDNQNIAWGAAGTDPYTWGTSIWQKVTPDSWANAATRVYSDKINYVDCNATLVNLQQSGGNPPLAIIFVEPSTMKPTTSNAPWQTGMYTNAMFFGSANLGGYHCYQRLNTPIGTNAANQGVMIDGECTTLGVNSPSSSPLYSVSWRGVKATFPGTGLYNIHVGGYANTLTVPNGTMTLFEAESMGYEDEKRFGFHIEHSQLSSIYTPYFIYTGAKLYSAPLATISDNSFLDTVFALGIHGVFARTLATYRNGANPTEADPQSFQFAGMGNASPGAIRVSPWMYIYNTLTGSRTLTVHFITDCPWDNDLNDVDMFAELFYPSSNTHALYSLVSTQNSNMGVPACTKNALTTDAATWTAPTIYYPTTWKIAISFSPQRAGFLMLRLNMASTRLARYITFVCPFVDIA